MTFDKYTGARMLRAAGLAAALTAVLLSSPSQALAEPAYYRWFQPSEKNLQSWLIRERNGDPYQIDILRRAGQIRVDDGGHPLGLEAQHRESGLGVAGPDRPVGENDQLPEAGPQGPLHIARRTIRPPGLSPLGGTISRQLLQSRRGGGNDRCAGHHPDPAAAK